MKTIPVRRIAPTRENPAPAARFIIRAVEHILDGKPLIHDLHKHDFFFVLVVRKGRGTHEIDFVHHAVQDHSIFVLRPGQVHRLELAAGAEGFLLEFDPGFFGKSDAATGVFWRRAVRKNACFPNAQRFSRLYAHLAGAYAEYTVRQEGYFEAIKAYLDLFVIDYARERPGRDDEVHEASDYTQARFDELMTLLDANIGELKQASQYAERMHLSLYQLNTIAKASVGKTVSTLIQEHILLEAKRNLLATPNQVKDIADGLGFEDVSYFIRFFRKHTGHAPEGFRRLFT